MLLAVLEPADFILNNLGALIWGGFTMFVGAGIGYWVACKDQAQEAQSEDAQR